MTDAHSRRSGDASAPLYDWLGLGNCHLSIGAYGRAVAAYERALEVARALGETRRPRRTASAT